MTEHAATDYARCLDCDKALPTPEDSQVHVREVMWAEKAAGRTERSHRHNILNPTMEEKARNAVGRIVEDATERACEAFDEEIRRNGFTEEQIDDAVRWYSDFADVWDEWKTS